MFGVWSGFNLDALLELLKFGGGSRGVEVR
jgi:hypothetical protein